jgi:hypothetical protein
MSHNPQSPIDPHPNKPRFKLLTFIVVFLCILLVVAIVLPSLGKARRLGARSTCPANLRGIMQSILVYAADNNCSYPYLGPQAVAAQPALTPVPGGLMHDIFVLVTNGQVRPEQFICRSDPAKTAASRIPAPSPVAYWTNPTGGSDDLCYSYSFAFQYSAPDQLAPFWKSTVDASVALAADMNPGTQILPGKTIANSLNHQGDGQNVVFADAHAEFVRTPDRGAGTDNFYHIGPIPSAPGTMPFPAPGTNDTCLLPILTNTTTYTRG